MQQSLDVVWHGRSAYASCPTCGKSVRLNKPIAGSAHLCLSACQKAGRHLDVRTRRRGPFWRRRTETYCALDGAVER